jgi:hypothetical protein
MKRDGHFYFIVELLGGVRNQTSVKPDVVVSDASCLTDAVLVQKLFLNQNITAFVYLNKSH